MFKSKIKSIFRPLYYLFNNGSRVNIQGYNHLKGFKWIVDKNYGMAYFKGYYEPEICRLFLKYLSEESIVIDVGAHAGYLSLFSAGITKNGHVYSFEPEPKNFSFIENIRNLNNVSNWTPINKAVGNEIGQLFFAPGNTSSTGRISTKGKLAVAVTALDIELKGLKRLDLIKIDVEGFGGRVIEGGINLITKLKPILMVEIHGGSDELQTTLTLLEKLYDFIDIENNELIISVNQNPHFIVGIPKKD